jgi:hypothetical protein
MLRQVQYSNSGNKDNELAYGCIEGGNCIANHRAVLLNNLTSREYTYTKPQINAVIGPLVAFICGVDYQSVALTKSYNLHF